MFHWLADHPEDRQKLREQPDIVGLAVDEFIRYTSGTTYIGRTTTRDVELHGCVIPAHVKVMLGYGPANRDPEKFDRPDEVILDRNPNHHLAFGMGPHRCAGSHLAKMEIRIALEQFLARVVDYEIEDHAKLTWVGGEARGLRSLPVVILD
jgi:cytochrome P450